MTNDDPLLLLVKHIEKRAVEFDDKEREGKTTADTGVRAPQESQMTVADRDRQLAARTAKVAELDSTLDKVTRDRTRLLEAAHERSHYVPLPLLFDRKHFVYVAFNHPNSEVGGVSDDAGEYQDGGNLPTYAGLIEAALNPRCYLTCHTLNLVRLPAAPIGQLKVVDNIPF